MPGRLRLGPRRHRLAQAFTERCERGWGCQVSTSPESQMAKGALTRLSEAHSIADLVPNVARAFLGLVESRGVSPELLCRGLGFTYADLIQLDLRLSHQQTRTLILRTAKLLGDPAIGLAAGARQTPVSWGLAGLGMLTCETLGEAIDYGVRHQNVTGSMVDNVMEVVGQELRLEALTRRYDPEIEPYVIEEHFASCIAVGRYLGGSDLRPVRLELGFLRPGLEAPYRQFFRCPVLFGASANRMVVDARWLGVRLAGFDRVTCGLLRDQIEAILRPPPGRPDLVEALATRLTISAEEAATQRALAQDINVSDRTLRRRLRSKSLTFSELRDATRYAKAKELLSSSSMTIAQIAEALGYSDARAFRRAFKRWSGVLPAEFRDQH